MWLPNFQSNSLLRLNQMQGFRSIGEMQAAGGGISVMEVCEEE